MKIPEYISISEVQRVCQELGISDWTELSSATVSMEEAKIVQAEVGGEALQISAEEFKQGLEVELEHGVQYPDSNVTNNHPILTGMIVLAHLKEMLDYYIRLEVAEISGDMLKALQSGNMEKLGKKYELLLSAQAKLSEHEKKAME
jgi:hypothetical protein